ncbi:MAG: hypothetical protein ABIJ00_13530 [Candidatus Eisenbacteria bacterium]
MRKAFLAGVMVLALAAPAFAGVGPGTMEKSLGGMFHLSPEPWELTGNMYLAYYVSPMVGIGPFFEIQKTGEMKDVVYWTGTDFDTGTYKPATYYRFGGFVKVYLPVTMAGGKLTPYVAAGGGIVTMPKPQWDDRLVEETESKFGYFGEFSIDYWATDSWTIWAGLRVSKVSGDTDTYFDMYGRDFTDMRSQILVGISSFK